MSNRLDWLAHSSAAHRDQWLRSCVRRRPLSGWLWWVLLELIQGEGEGDTLRVDLPYLAAAVGVHPQGVPPLLEVLSEADFSKGTPGQQHLIYKEEGGGWVYLEVPGFREKQHNIRKNLPQNGSKTVAKRYETGSKSTLEKSRVEKSREEESRIPPLPPTGFQEFYSAYPRHEAKAAALKAWIKLKPGPELQATILAAVARHRQSDQWQRDSGKFIPHPASWLNAERWKDEVNSNAREIPADLIGPNGRPITPPGKYAHLE